MAFLCLKSTQNCFVDLMIPYRLDTLQLTKTIVRVSKVGKKSFGRRLLGFWDYDSLECKNCEPGEGLAEVLSCRAKCWSPWGNWSPCSRDCGSHGVMTRVRSVITTECACLGARTETSYCNVFCLNGGQPIPGNLTHSCYCLSGYSGQCCEIAENETVSSSGNHDAQNMDAKNLKGSVNPKDDSSNLSMPLIIGMSVSAFIILVVFISLVLWFLR